jgi:hypothetical protein
MLTQQASTEVIPGLMFDYILDGQVVRLTASNSSTDVIDAFVNTMKQVEQDQPLDKPLFYLLDFSQNFAGFITPYGKMKVGELVAYGSKVVSYSAIILPKLFVMQTAQLFLNQIQREGATNRAFFSHDQALKWLEDAIKANS